MKFSILLIASLFILTTAVPVENQNEIEELQPRIINFLSDFYNMIIAEPVNTLASSLAGMAAQLAAGVALSGLTPLVGKRETIDLVQNLVENAKVALMNFFNTIRDKLVAIYSQISTVYPLPRGHLDNLLNSLNELANTIVQTTAMSITQILANFSMGKRGVFDDLLNTLQNSLYELGNAVVTSTAMSITQLLANFSMGKRELSKGAFDNLLSTLQNSLYELGNAVVTSTAMSITQILANFSMGKRELSRGAFDNLLSTLQNSLYELGNAVVTSTAMSITQILANFSMGKRELSRGISDFFSNFGSNVFNTVDGLVQAGAFQLATLLSHISNNGLLPTIGKRSNPVSVDSFVQQLLNLINQTTGHLNSGSGSHLIGK